MFPASMPDLWTSGALTLRRWQEHIPRTAGAWPRRMPTSVLHADYQRTQTGIEGGGVLALPIRSFSPLYTASQADGSDLPGNGWPIYRRPGDQIEIHAGALDPAVVAGVGATALQLEIWGAEHFPVFHWIRPPILLAAAAAAIANFGIGTTIEGGPRYFFGVLRFVDLGAVPATPCLWWVKS